MEYSKRRKCEMTEYTNEQMAGMISDLEPLLGRTDAIGYAAARNTRILRNECVEYMEMRDRLINKYGTEQLDESGNPTGRVELRFNTPEFRQFKQEIETYEQMRHKPKLFKLKFEEAKGKISGAELLACDWMFED